MTTLPRMLDVHVTLTGAEEVQWKRDELTAQAVGVALRPCAHCWHLHGGNAARSGASPQAICCHCGDNLALRGEGASVLIHGPYAPARPAHAEGAAR